MSRQKKAKLNSEWNGIMEVMIEKEAVVMPTIPLVDIRSGGPLDLLNAHGSKAIELINASRNTFGLASYMLSAPAFAIGDSTSKQWLEKTNNPYREEIDAMAQRLSISGIYALNMCYEWACTSGAYRTGNDVTLARVLDWPFPKMGENIVVAHQRGHAGDFYNVTWPGVSGMFNGMAAGKFAASLNQAPMQQHGLTFVGDWAKNRYQTWHSNALPPAHLLRRVFETANTYDEAKKLLTETPIALPVIYTLCGTAPHQACVIERIEHDAAIRDITGDRVTASNQFETRLNKLGKGWLPREIDSPGRMRKSCEIPISSMDDKFSWFVAPIANAHSCLAMTANAATGKLAVMGVKGSQAVTNVFRL